MKQSTQIYQNINQRNMVIREKNERLYKIFSYISLMVVMLTYSEVAFAFNVEAGATAP
jgi:hypothetical protein